MKLDVLRMLDLEYLNGLTLEINKEIDKLKNSFLEQYDLDKLKELSMEDVNALFNGHGIKNDAVIRYLESDFIDETWEFADLFKDDILYSSGLRDEIKNDASKELDELNNKINLINSDYKQQISECESSLIVVDKLLKLINTNGDILEEDIDILNENIITSRLSGEDKFILSYNIVRYLFEKNKEFSLRSSKDDISEFEKTLEDTYASSKYMEVKSYNEIKDPVYSETIIGYYEYYKKLFDNAKLGDTLGQIMDNSYELCIGVNPSIISLAKDDFCIEIGALLYLLNKNQGKEVANQELVADALMDLALLDKFYEEDYNLSSDKEKLLSKIKSDIEIVCGLSTQCSFADKIHKRLKLLLDELEKNLINSKRKDEIDTEYNEIQKDFIKLPETIKQMNELSNLKERIIKLLNVISLPTGFVTDDYYMELSELQSVVIKSLETVEMYGASKDISDKILNISHRLNEYNKLNGSNKEEEKKTYLKGFVLFDFDENNKPYVISDLDPHNKHSLLDDVNVQKKITSSFEDYNSLINDLLLYGEPEILRDEIPTYVDRILDNIYIDGNRKYPTKMVRIRPKRNSLVRFISQKVILHSGTEIFNQVSSIIQEILPNVDINLNEDFALYINFASSLKKIDTDSYDKSINRYNRKSPLYKLFIENDGKTKLTDYECDLLRDIVHMSLDAYSELEKKNEHLNFDIIKQIGGMKTRG